MRKEKKMGKTKKQKNTYAEYLRTGLDIRYLAQKYRKAHEWIPRLSSEAPGLRPEEALIKVRERLKELRHTRKRLKESRLSERLNRVRQEPDSRRSIVVRAMPHKEMSYVCSAGSPGSIQLTCPRPPLDLRGLYPTIREFPWQRFPQGSETNDNSVDRVDGIARASGFKEYVWAVPRNDDTDESHFFLPYGAGNDPNDFTGATGLQFSSQIEVQPNIFLDDTDACGFAGILQYSLPEAPWDGAVQWRLQQQFEIPGITCDADFGYFSLVSTGRACPSWEDFPAFDAFVESFSLDQLLPVISATGEDFSVGPLNAIDTFLSGFRVTEGQKSCIYVGFSIYIMARDGSMSLGDPNMAYDFWPDTGSGLSYTFVRIGP
jgi:hypothetical protein